MEEENSRLLTDAEIITAVSEEHRTLANRGAWGIAVAKAQNVKTARLIIKYLDEANDTRDLDRKLQTLKTEYSA